jgi:hypothetical protein
VVVSNIKKAIPDSVKTMWREWRASMKKASSDIPGGEEIGEGIEMAGWGVEEADKKNKSEAST